jgi:diguanylate cyclase (GGDEF)-like protein/PAS domain S-box-containing protein
MSLHWRAIPTTIAELTVPLLMKFFLRMLLTAFLLYGQAVQAVPTGQATVLQGRLYQADGENPPASSDELPAWIAKLHEVKSVSPTGGGYWFYAKIAHVSGEQHWVLEPGNRLIERIDARIYAQDKTVQHFTSGYLAEREYMLHYGHDVRLPESASVLIRFDSPYYPSTPKVRLYPKQTYQHLVLLEDVMIIAALGALIALALYNFFIYTITRDRALLYYAFYLIDYFIAWAFTLQLPAELLGWHDLHLHYIWFFLLPVLSTLFYTEFLELKSNFPRLAAISRINIVLPLVLLPSCFFALPYAHLLATIVITLWIALALVCGVASMMSGFRPARYFVAAFSALLIPGMIILPANFGLIPEVVRNAELFTLLGGTLDGILLAFALAFKIKLLAEEKARAMQQMSSQELVNKALQLNVQERTEQNALLEDMNYKLESAQMHLRTSQGRLQAILDNSPIGIWLAGTDGRFQVVNRTFCNAIGIMEKDFLEARQLANIIGLEAAGQFLKSDHACLGQDMPHVSQEKMIFVDGKQHHLEITKVKLRDDTGGTAGIIGTAVDITDRRAAEDEIRNLAFYDTLTGLPNRRLFIDRLGQALEFSARTGQRGAMLFIDLDNFKTINDTLGHDVGDVLLQQVARRLVSCVRAGDTVARLGGDEFVIILDCLSDHLQEAVFQVEALAEKILDMLNQPYQLAGHDRHSTPSIGVTTFADHTLSTDELMKRADIAMYSAKKAGRNAIRFFDPEMQSAVEQRSSLNEALKQALPQQQFILYYQAQVDNTDKIVGAEVLLRWMHPERGMIMPDEFIPVAEETGAIVAIGLWVVETACRQLKLWASDPDKSHLHLAVNVSARQFQQVNFVEQISAVLRETDIDPARLTLELTESMVLGNIAETIDKMQALKQVGVKFAMDDFGTGHSSLSSLKKLPLDQLKIDQSFVRDIALDQDGAIIVQTIIAMANNLGMQVFAEGVETEAQRDFLIAHCCLQFQGYLFARPVPLAEFERALLNAAGTAIFA